MKKTIGKSVVTADGMTVIPIVESYYYSDISKKGGFCTGVSEAKAVLIVTLKETLCINIEGYPIEPGDLAIDVSSLTATADDRSAG